MYQIDSSGSVPTMPAPGATGTPGWFTGGNPSVGQAATILDADWFNAVQAEMIAIVSAAGIAPNKTADNQILLSLQALFAAVAGNAAQKFNVAAATSSSNAVNLGQFGASVAQNGWRQDPSGLIEQWGLATTNNVNGSVTVAFPEPFPNSCFNVVVTNAAGAPPQAFGAANIVGASSFVLWAASSAGASAGSGLPFYWRAIGH